MISYSCPSASINARQFLDFPQRGLWYICIIFIVFNGLRQIEIKKAILEGTKVEFESLTIHI
jgi:hypothetical protein